MRTHVTHALTFTFLFHSCVSRTRTLRASKHTFTVRFFVWRMPTCHNGLFYTDEGLCPKLTFYCYDSVTHHFSNFSLVPRYMLRKISFKNKFQVSKKRGVTCILFLNNSVFDCHYCWALQLHVHSEIISFTFVTGTALVSLDRNGRSKCVQISFPWDELPMTNIEGFPYMQALARKLEVVQATVVRNLAYLPALHTAPG